MRSTRLACLFLVLAVAAVPHVRAQEAAPDSLPGAAVKVPLARDAAVVPASSAAPVRTLARGETVRVVSAAGTYQGTIARISADTIVVAAPGRLDAIRRGDVTSLERMTGHSSRGQAITRGAGAGLLAGGLLGAVAGRVVGRVHCTGDAARGCVEGTHDGTIQGALLAEGAVVGALLGAMLGPTFRHTRWEDARGGFPAAVAPADGGVAAGVSLRF